MFKPVTLADLGQPRSRDPPMKLAKTFVATATSHIASLISLQVLFSKMLLASNSLNLRVSFCGIHLEQWPFRNMLLINHVACFFLLSRDKS